MKLKKVMTVYKKELKDTLRDRRTLMVMVLVPIILYPVLFLVMGQIMALGTQQLEREKSTIAYIAEIPAELDSLLQVENKLNVLVSLDPAVDLKTRKIQAYLEIKHYEPKDSVFIYFDAAIDRSRLAEERLEKVVQAYKKHIEENSLQKAGINLVVLEPFGIRTVNTAPPARMGGMLVGSIIPLLLIVTLMLGAMYPAIDLTAGEKERGTLETILTVPVGRLELLMGKYLTVTTIALITGILNLLSMSLTYASGFIQMGALSGKVEFTFSPFAMLILFLLIIPLSLFLSAAILSVCLFARSFKDAQNFVTPLLLLVIFPALFALTPGIELTNFLSLIPILNICLVFKEIMLQNFPLELIFSTFLSTTVYAIMAILIFSRLFNAEEILFAEGKGWQFSLKRSEIMPTEVFQPSSALLIFSVLMVLIFYIGSPIQSQSTQWGVLVTEWVLLFLPIVLAIWYNKVDSKNSLNLRGFQPIALLGTILLVFGGLVLTIWVAQLQEMLFPEAARIREILEKLLNFKSLGIDPLLGLFMFAISPGICEELLFRGIILSSLKKRLSPTLTVTMVALLFGLFHLHIFRILPAALIGLCLTFIVYETGSIYLSIIGHAFVNGFSLMVASYPSFGRYFAWLGGETGETPISPIVIIVMIPLVALGVFLIRYAKRLTNQTN